jgi:hypothetical protein
MPQLRQQYGLQLEDFLLWDFLNGLPFPRLAILFFVCAQKAENFSPPYYHLQLTS